MYLWKGYGPKNVPWIVSIKDKTSGALLPEESCTLVHFNLDWGKHAFIRIKNEGRFLAVTSAVCDIHLI